VLIFPILTKPPKSKENPNLGNELAQELGEIAGWALSMDKHERDQLLLTPSLWSETAQKAKKQADVHSDSVRAFIDSCLCYSENDGDVITLNDLFDYYKSYCEVAKFKFYSINKFSSQLKQILAELYLEPTPFKNPQTKKTERLKTRYCNIALVDEDLFTKSILHHGAICNQSKLSEGGYAEILEILEKRRLSDVTDVTDVTDEKNSYTEDISEVTPLEASHPTSYVTPPN